jgi:hypothetical protein
MEEDHRPGVELGVDLVEVGQGRYMSTPVVLVYASVINGWMPSRMSEYLKGLVLLTVQRRSVTRVGDRIRSFAHRCLPP